MALDKYNLRDKNAPRMSAERLSDLPAIHFCSLPSPRGTVHLQQFRMGVFFQKKTERLGLRLAFLFTDENRNTLQRHFVTQILGNTGTGGNIKTTLGADSVILDGG